jgi:hypothetical protein
VVRHLQLERDRWCLINEASAALRKAGAKHDR